MSEDFINPTELLHAYEVGQIMGAWLDIPLLPAAIRQQARYEQAEVMETLDYPRLIYDAPLGAIVGSSKGKLCAPWKFYLRSDAELALSGAQLTGDCVSWGVRTASDITRCWKIWMSGGHEYRKRQATCLIYSGRGHNGRGASPAKLSKWHVNTGFLLEDVFTGTDGKKWDFTTYSNYVRLGMSYGRVGFPNSITDITKEFRHQQTSLTEDMDSLADCLYNGYGAHCGSGIGVSSTGDPISSLRGYWAHDMAIVGFDDRPETHEKYGSRIWFWDNSWGNWNRVSNIPDDWKPWGQGMFALSENSTWKAVRQGGTWVFAETKGFPAQPFDNLLV
jgi:hypothetical protein